MGLNTTDKLKQAPSCMLSLLKRPLLYVRSFSRGLAALKMMPSNPEIEHISTAFLTTMCPFYDTNAIEVGCYVLGLRSTAKRQAS